jgi:23S rRNA pseudouridine955/2504/2580 synthase
LPPIRTSAKLASTRSYAPDALFCGPVLLEDDDLLIVDKPSGIAVHGGSGISMGVIERLREARPDLRYLELVHRLDRSTSGALILAKKRTALTALHAQLREGRVRKHYLALVLGEWKDAKRNVRVALHKYVTGSGERRVVANEEGQHAHSVFRLVRNLPGYSLLGAELKTGRTHQIRVHLAHVGYPIAGDDKYGDFEANKRLAKLGLKRMFLHAASLEFNHPRSAQSVRIEAPLAAELEHFLQYVQGAASAKDA